MSRLNFTYEVTHTPNANPRTLCQIVTPTNQRVFLAFIDMQPGGADGAVAPIPFDMLLQTTAGTSSGGSFVKSLPQAAETIQTTVLETFTAEPTVSDIVDSFALHPQGHQTWIPSGGGITIPGNSRLGIRYKSATFVPVTLRLHLEE